MFTSHIVIGLGYGDEGKGSWVDHLIRRHSIRYVVRMNGGAQAGHNVVAPDGRSHIFAQLGAGSFVPETFTLLSRFMLVEPEALRNEANAFEQKGIFRPLGRVLISENAPIITPFSRQLNRIQEVFRGASRHGSCGFGIGLTQGDVERLGDRALYMRDLNEKRLLREKLSFLGRCRLDEAERYRNASTAPLIEEMANTDVDYYVESFWSLYQSVGVVEDGEIGEILASHPVVFEGAQGALLDQSYGFFPYVTRSNCTFENAMTLLEEAGFSGRLNRVGLLRGYATRHGAGPFVTEDPTLNLPPCTNATNPWQGQFRLGWFDAVAARYALKVVGGVDTLSITNVDRMSALLSLKVAVRYDHSASPFFEDGELRAERFDYSALAVRSAAMADIQPVYQELGGFGDRGLTGCADYVEQISNLVGRNVEAYSLSADCQKVYR
ncbi:MAG: adenylosuccinate synthetase [Bdellovibrionota bacterium]